MNEDIRSCGNNSCGPFGGLFDGDNNMMLIIIVFLLFFSNGFGCDK